MLFHTHTTALVTEVFLLPALGCGTPCHHICGHELQTFQACTERTYV